PLGSPHKARSPRFRAGEPLDESDRRLSASEEALLRGRYNLAFPMSTLVSAGRRVLPRGWADFCRPLAIWFGFLALYQVARGIADRNPPKAFDNGLHVIGIERHF